MQKNKLAIWFSFLAFVCPGITVAADSCNALLTVGIYNVTQSSSATEGKSLAKSTFCSANYSLNSTTSSVQASIKAAYGLFSGGASGSITDSQIIETQKNVCTSGFNSSIYSNEASNNSWTVYQGALDGWNQCNNLASKGINVEIQAVNTMQAVTVSLSTSLTGIGSKFLGLSQSGLGTSVCKATTAGRAIKLAENMTFNLSSSDKLTVICKRVIKKDSKGNFYANAQTLTFNTSSGILQLPLSGIGSLPRFTVEQAKAEIESAVAAGVAKDVNNQLTNQQNQITALQTKLSNLLLGNSLYVNPTSGNVGINTTNPTSNLHVNGVLTLSDAGGTFKIGSYGAAVCARNVSPSLGACPSGYTAIGVGSVAFDSATGCQSDAGGDVPLVKVAPLCVKTQ